MASDHDFCRTMLYDARQQAKRQGVKLPKRITACGPSGKQYFIEADGVKGEWVKADCAWHAKAEYILGILNWEADGVPVL